MKKIFNTKNSKGLLSISTIFALLCGIAFNAAAYHRAFIDQTLTPIPAWGFAHCMLIFSMIFGVVFIFFLVWYIIKHHQENIQKYESLFKNGI